MLIKYITSLFIVFFSFIFSAQTIKTIKNGHWEDPTVWSNGQIPSGIDTIFILHYITLHQNQTIASPTVLYIDSLGTICGDYLLETLCGAKFINYGHLYLNEIKTKLGSNYQVIQCRTSIVVSGCSFATNGLINYPPNGSINVWPPVFCETIDTNWEMGNTNNISEILKSNINLYPSPLYGNTLFIKSTISGQLIIFDMLGNSLLKSNIENNHEINVGNLSEGIYTVIISFDNVKYSAKLIKVN